ncbi:WD40 repeat domain-containing protein [Streptomyces sp. NPDC048566]|uniref:WD40 repeat domain-containing protein n=1 Tax=Streptomyces sp. NPDC048566 TaxID=3365569 RepID=UPI003719F778
MLDRLRSMEGEDPAPRDLALTLTYALARMQNLGPATDGDAPPYLRHAQAALEIAVEWKMPVVERWLVAWLTAADLPHLRMRWSNRSRDGRARMDGRAAGAVHAMTGTGSGICLGTVSGAVEAWTPGRAVEPIENLPSAVWTVAATGDWLFAAGPNARFVGRGPTGSATWPELPHTAGISAAAVTGAGHVVFGDEQGAVRVCEPGRQWNRLPAFAPSKVIAVAIDEERISAVWRDGRVTVVEHPPAEGRVRFDHHLGGTVACAAWAADGQLAFVLDEDSRVCILREGTVRTAWRHPGVRILAWSPGGRLASAGADQKIRTTRPEPGTEPDELGVESRITAVAFVNEGSLVTAHDHELMQWDLARSGSDDPTFETGETITAVGLDPLERGRSAVGTQLGLLQEYDGRGTALQWSPPRVTGTVHQLVRHRQGWLVAGQDGAYWWSPPAGEPHRLSHRLCLAVATWRGRPVYGHYAEVVTPGHPSGGDSVILMTFEVPVRDIATGDDGSLAALDRNGTLQVLYHDGRRWRRWRQERAGDRLLSCSPDGPLLLSRADGVVSALSRRGTRHSTRLHPGAVAVAVGGDGELVAAYGDRGVAVFRRSSTATPDDLAPIAVAPGRFTCVAAASGRVVAAGGGRTVGYDTIGPDARDATTAGAVNLLLVREEGGCRIRFPGGGSTFLRERDLARFEECANSTTVGELSEAVHLGGRLGDHVWFGGLDREIDMARAADPGRAVRLNLLIDGDHLVSHPWELLHPAGAALCWFDTPPVTMLRVTARLDGNAADDIARTPTGRPRMLVTRTDDPLLAGVDEAYDRMRRRTRRSNVRLVSGLPLLVKTTEDLDRALSPTDVLHLWAHSGPDGVVLPSGTTVPVPEMARRISRTGARLVVLVGCRSAALGRTLVQHGVEAVVGMRTGVYSHTVQSLVEELTTRILAGVPVDLAFVEALRQYVLTGQPGAPAIPLLHLRAGSTGALFHQAEAT